MQDNAGPQFLCKCGKIVGLQMGMPTGVSTHAGDILNSAMQGVSQADRDAGHEWLATHDEDWRRALEVQASLWRSGHLRAVGLPDLLVAAVAERERVIVLHYDGDHDPIARVTGQPTQWVLPRGTVA